jgi:hypothetical protein
MSTPFGPAAVLDTVKNRQQLTLVCLRRFVFWLLFGLGVKTWKGKSGWMEQLESTSLCA